MPKTALPLLSERGYEIECDKVFGRVCDKGASFEIKLNDNATREDPLSFEAHEKVNVSGMGGLNVIWKFALGNTAGSEAKFASCMFRLLNSISWLN
jgi:hypothetical protein